MPLETDRDRHRHALRRRGGPRGKVPPVTDILQCTPMRAAETNTRPAFAMPPGACDTHFHVFEPGYPHVPAPLYTFPDGTAGQYLDAAGFLGLTRMVLVQPTYYGTDNSLLRDVLKRLGPRCS